MPDAATNAILRDIALLAVLATMLGVAAYAMARRVAPLTGWNYRGNVLTRLYDIPDAVLAVLLAVLLVQGLFTDASADPATPLAPVGMSSESEQLGMLISQLFFSLLISIGLVCYLRFVRGFDPAELFGVRNLSPGKVITVALTVIAPAMVIVGLVNAGVSDLLKDVWPDASPQEIVKTFETTGSLAVRLLMVVAAVVVAPLSEELLFRGFLYGVCKRYTDSHFAALINALLFATVHMHVGSFAPLFTLALLLVLVYEITGSLVVPMLIHALFNGLMMIAMLAGGE